MLVGFDPCGRHAGVLQESIGHRPVSRKGVIRQREPFPLIRETVEQAVIHRLTDLPLDQRLTDPLARWLGGIGALGTTLPDHAPSVAQCADRQAVADPR